MEGVPNLEGDEGAVQVPDGKEMRRRRSVVVRDAFRSGGCLHQAIERLNRENYVDIEVGDDYIDLIADIEQELKRRGFDARRIYAFSADKPACPHKDPNFFTWKAGQRELHAYFHKVFLCDCQKPEFVFIRIAIASSSCCNVC